jgi:hypothetical protein
MKYLRRSLGGFLPETSQNCAAGISLFGVSAMKQANDCGTKRLIYDQI